MAPLPHCHIALLYLSWGICRSLKSPYLFLCASVYYPPPSPKGVSSIKGQEQGYVSALRAVPGVEQVLSKLTVLVKNDRTCPSL